MPTTTTSTAIPTSLDRQAAGASVAGGRSLPAAGAIGAPVTGRVCQTGIRLVGAITETLTVYDDASRTLTYEAAGTPAFVTLARNTWTVTPIDAQANRVSLRARFDTRGPLGLLGRAERRESVTLAFITALQRLPATQRAALILRDVLAWTAREVAELLDTTVPAVNSALQRARVTTAAARTAPAAALTDRERQVLDRFVQAWHRQDIPALAAPLCNDVILTMPPELEVVIGRDRVTHFLSTVPADGRPDRIRLVHTRANGQPALASYLHEADGTGHGYGIMVFTVVGDAVAGIVGFPGPDLYDRFALPQVWDRPVVGGTAQGR